MTSRRHQIGIISRLEPVQDWPGAKPSLWFTRARWFIAGLACAAVVAWLTMG